MQRFLGPVLRHTHSYISDHRMLVQRPPGGGGGDRAQGWSPPLNLSWSWKPLQSVCDPPWNVDDITRAMSKGGGVECPTPRGSACQFFGGWMTSRRQCPRGVCVLVNVQGGSCQFLGGGWRHVYPRLRCHGRLVPTTVLTYYSMLHSLNEARDTGEFSYLAGCPLTPTLWQGPPARW